MPSLNVFDQDGFSLMSMTAAINDIPEVPTLIGGLGIFEEDGVDTTVIAIEKQDESLTLVGSTPRGGPGESVGGESRTLRDFRVPHFQRNDSVLADEVQNVRAFGTENVLQTVQSRVNQKMMRHTRSFDFTVENLRLGAIKGLVLDKDGSTLFDLSSEFGLNEPAAVNFELDQTTTNVRDKTRQVLDTIEDALEGFQARRVYGIAGDDFFAALIDHTSVKTTYQNWEASVALRSDPRMPFEFGGISWVRYHTKPKAKAARNQQTNNEMIAAGSTRFVAAGVPELFITRYAPADYEETVNTMGLPRYARQYAMPNGKGRLLEMQTNVICLCTKPNSLASATWQ